MDFYKMELYWNDIPTEKEKAITYPELIEKWGLNERKVRYILHDLSSFDNGDNYILVRSGANKGFYKTDNISAIKVYKNECLNKGRSIFAPIKKINRVLIAETAEQIGFTNNLQSMREAAGLRQIDVCNELQKFDNAIDKAMLSKMENGLCVPTPFQLSIMAKIYDCRPDELINYDLLY